MGEGTFESPSVGTVYTNGTLDVSVKVEGDVENVELVLDEQDVLTTFDASGSYAWDTTALAEGPYELAVRYDLGGSTRWGFENLDVIVDRTAPELTGATPAAAAEDVKREDAFTLTFSEPLDPDTVDASTFSLTFDPAQSVTPSVTLSDDGKTVTIDFDRSALALPAKLDLKIQGAADFAGNTYAEATSYEMPAWFHEELGAILSDTTFLSTDAGDYVVGLQQGPSDTVRVYRRQPDATWTESASVDVGTAYAIDAAYLDGTIVIAALRRDTVSQLVVKVAQLYRFSTVRGNLLEGGQQVVSPDSNDGTIALDLRAGAGKDLGAIAAVTDGKLRVFEFEDLGLSLSSQNVFPSNDYEYVRDEDLHVHIDVGQKTEVLFARCVNGSEPCVRTYVERVSESNGVWTAATSPASTPLTPGISNNCDEYTNFDVSYVRDTATLMFPHHAPCNALAPGLRAYRTNGDTWTRLLDGVDVYASMPSPGPYAYGARSAVIGGVGHVLFHSDSRLLLGELEATGFDWLAPTGEELGATGASVFTSFSEVGLSKTADGAAVVTARYGIKTHLWFSN